LMCFKFLFWQSVFRECAKVFVAVAFMRQNVHWNKTSAPADRYKLPIAQTIIENSSIRPYNY
jgi:hypothetical protein